MSGWGIDLMSAAATPNAQVVQIAQNAAFATPPDPSSIIVVCAADGTAQQCHFTWSASNYWAATGVVIRAVGN